MLSIIHGFTFTMPGQSDMLLKTSCAIKYDENDDEMIKAHETRVSWRTLGCGMCRSFFKTRRINKTE